MRLLLKLIVLIVVLVIAGIIALPFIVDPNDYKQQISEQVEKATGRQLTLDGDIGLSVFPWVALELGSTSLSNAKGFTADNFAQFDGAQIRIKLMPLLNKTLEMDTIVLDGLTLNLEKNKAGITNWEDLGQQSDSEIKEETTPSEPATGLAAMTIAGIQLSDANIVWSDKSTGEQYTIQSLNLTTDPLIEGKPTAIDMQFSVLGEGKEKLAADIDLSTSLLANFDTQHFVLSDFNFKTEASGDAIPAINMLLNTHIDADLSKQTAQLSDIRLTVNDVIIESDINVSQLSSEQPQINGQLALKPLNLRQFAQKMGIELPVTADANVLNTLELNSKLAGSTDQVKLSNLILTLDQSKLTGDVAIQNFAKPAINFNLALDQIDADRYLPPATDEQAQTASPATAGAAAASELPIDVIRDLNMNGRFTIGELKVSGTQSQNIDINIKANNGAVTLHPLKAELYQGQYNGNIKLNATKNSLAVSINEQLSKVQAEPLLKDLTGDAKVTGLVNGKVALTGQGKTVDQIKAALSGKGNFSFTDGAIKGIDILGSIRKAKAVLKGQTLSSSELADKTEFSSFTGSFSANKGLIKNPDLSLIAPLIKVNGSGQADLKDESIDYGLKAAILATEDSPIGKELIELKGLTVPVRISGHFSDPKPNIDLASLLRDNATQKIKDKVKDKLKDKLGGDLGDLVGGALLGGSSSEGGSDSNDANPKEAPKSVEDALKEELGNKLKGFF